MGSRLTPFFVFIFSIEILSSRLRYHQVAQVARWPARPICSSCYGSIYHEVRNTGLGSYVYTVSLSHLCLRCLTCGNYVYKGKKFNARKEDAKGEKYLGIQIYRFYIRCPECLSEITFKVCSGLPVYLELHVLSVLQTDPQNSDYAPEHGAMRTFQVSS